MIRNIHSNSDGPRIPGASKTTGPTPLGLAVAALLLLASLPCRAEPLPQLAVPSEGAYTGAYVDFGDTEDDVTRAAIDRFAEMTGKRPAIVASSSYWGRQDFPTRNVKVITKAGAVPLIYWSPWDKPYDEDRLPDRFSLTNILDGEWDAYIDSWADAAKATGVPILVSFCNEMNGNWFPWSGIYYGKGKLKDGEPRGPGTFKKAWRHVVDRVRARGATNISWVFHVMDYPYPNTKWNMMGMYYPGSDYVDWLGLSVYGKQFGNEPWVSFADVMDYPFEEIARLDPGKPIMLAEWGIGEFPETGSKADWIAEAFRSMTGRDRLKAAVFWHERWQNEDESYSNLRVNSSRGALEAYRRGVASPFWLSKPQIRE